MAIGGNSTKFSVPGTGKSNPMDSPMEEMREGARSGKSVLAKRTGKKGTPKRNPGPRRGKSSGRY